MAPEDFVQVEPDLMPFVVPVVLVTAREGDFDNLMAVAWFGVACSEPPCVSVAIRPGRTTNPMIRKSWIFGVSVPGPDLVKEVDFAGTQPGSRVNKWEALSLEMFYGEKTGVPLVRKCPVNLECQVRHVIRLGTHDLFIGEVVNLYLNERVLENDTLATVPLNHLLYCHPQQRYYETGRPVGMRGKG